MRLPKLPRFIHLALISMATAIACSALIHALALNFGWDILPLLYQLPIGLALATLFLIVPLVVGAMIALILISLRPSHQNKTLPRWVSGTLSFYGLLLVHTLASITTSQVITGYQMNQVEAFGDRLIAELEDYKAQYGDYPENLNGFKSPIARPYFLREQAFFYAKYTSTGSGYKLMYSNPWDLSFSLYSYDSGYGEWEMIGPD